MKHLLTFTLIMVSTVVCAQQPPTLTTYQQSYAKQEQAIVAKYGTTLTTRMAELKKKGDLDGLIKSETAADRIEEAKAVKAEKEKATVLLEEVKGKLPVKEGAQKPTSPEQEKPVAPKPIFMAKTLVNETKGFTGLTSYDNVYTFKVESVGKKASFRFWASGDISTDTAGQILLSGPNLKDQIIRSWKPSDFKIAANTARSYKNLKPISCDVTAYLKYPGDYQFTFKWGGSQAGLSILRVELELQ